MNASGAQAPPLALARKTRRATVNALMLLSPGLIVVALLCLLPLLGLIANSIHAGADASYFFKRLLLEAPYPRILVGTFLLAVKCTLLCLLLGYPLAYWMTRIGARWQRICLLLVIVPYLTSFLVRTYAWIVILADNGVINGTLLSLGAIHEPLGLLYSDVGVLIGMTHIMLPFMVLPLYNVMRQIDERLLRAALSLGCGPARAFTRVFLPLSLPGVRSGCALVFVLALGFYITPLALGRANDITLAGLIELQVFELLDLGFAAASALVLLVLTLLVLAAFGGAVAGNALQAIAQQGSSGGNRSRTGRITEAWRALRINLNSTAFARSCGDLLGSYRARRRAAARTRGRDGFGFHAGKGFFVALAVLVLVFLMLPTLIVIPMSFNAADHLAFPPQHFSLRWYRNYVSDPAWLDATWLSVRIAAAAAVLATLAGTLAAYSLFKYSIRGRRILVAALMSPLIVPAIVLGVCLYDLFVRWHLIGSPLALMLAHTVVAMPYVLVTVSASLARFDPALERAASSLGATGWQTFRRVTLPLIAPGLISGGLFAFIHSFDEVVVSIFVSGYVTRTLPLKMWENVRHEVDPTIAAISALMLILLVVCLVVAQLGARARHGARAR